MGGRRVAKCLAVGHKEIVVLNPVALRQHFPQGHFRLIRSFCIDHSPAVRDSMNMRVDTDTRLPEPQSQHEVRRLPPYTLYRQ